MDEKGASLAILDSTGQVIFQSGDVTVDDRQAPDMAVSLSHLLPHWQVGVYLDKEASAPGSGFLYISVLLLFVFMAAIVSGGVLLTRQAVRYRKEALQKTSFVSSVSHELKTPLTSIRMYAELLQSGRVSSEQKQASYLAIMVAESRRLTRLINNVLDFSRLEQKKKTYHKTSVNLEVMLLAVVDTHSILIQDEGFEIQTDIAPGGFHVTTDPDALEQVVLNLVDNALKYAACGRYIGFILERGPDNTVYLKICDRGPGIASEHRKTIFDKFYRVDNSLTSTRPGSGLGLSIARRIMRDLGGDLFHESVPGGGSCFVIRIPER
jgi:signal transduction histidine kinase